MLDYVSNGYTHWVYDNDGMTGVAMSDGLGGFDLMTVNERLYGEPDGFDGYVINGDRAGFTLPNVFGGQDYYSENGYEGTAMPFMDF